MRTKAEAEARAKQVLAMTKTPGWSACVTNNLDWFWCLENVDGHLCLWESCRGGKFYCLLSSGDYSHSGSFNWSSSSFFKDPNAAVAHTLKLARAYTDRVDAWISKVETACTPKSNVRPNPFRTRTVSRSAR